MRMRKKDKMRKEKRWILSPMRYILKNVVWTTRTILKFFLRGHYGWLLSSFSTLKAFRSLFSYRRRLLRDSPKIALTANGAKGVKE
jgi:hypothetical protein